MTCGMTHQEVLSRHEAAHIYTFFHSTSNHDGGVAGKEGGGQEGGIPYNMCCIGLQQVFSHGVIQHTTPYQDFTWISKSIFKFSQRSIVFPDPYTRIQTNAK